jgi:hypothetical protein
MDTPHEKRTNHRDDPDADSSQPVRKQRKQMVHLKRPTYHTESESEEKQALKMHTLEEQGTRNYVDYMNAEQSQITARREEACYDGRKIKIDLRF